LSYIKVIHKKEAVELLPRFETLKILIPNEIDALKNINFDLVLSLEENAELVKVLTRISTFQVHDCINDDKEG
jgi:hypothetical protein